jgi:hypothetical protein
MKFIGFIKEHDNDSFAKELRNFYLAENIGTSHRQEIIEYLKKGVMCVAFMGLVEDEDEELMGKISIYTDGVWYWPEYFLNYLTKYPNFKVEDGFVQHVIANKNKRIELSENKLLELEEQFYKLAGLEKL